MKHSKALRAVTLKNPTDNDDAMAEGRIRTSVVSRGRRSTRYRNVPKWLVLGFSAALWLILAPLSAYAGQRTVDVQLTDEGFSPKTVLAALNQPIVIHVVNTGRHTHQFSIPYYRVYSSALAPGGVTTIGFSPWTEGRFEMVSDPSGTNQPEFKGLFTVIDGK